jgi:hypothetical protein
MSDFPIKPGDTLKKAKIHQLVGGSAQHAMTSCLDGKAFLVFYDPVQSRNHSYDLWEGEQGDGSFWYTGQGLIGSQQMTRSNEGLRKAGEKGLPIHFFRRPAYGVKRVKAEPYTYVGQVVLGEPPFEIKKAPDTNGDEREVFVFRLILLGASAALLADRSVGAGISTTVDRAPWNPNVAETATPSGSPTPVAQIELEENKLQNRFAAYLKKKGVFPERFTIKIGNTKGSLAPDFVVQEWGLIIEAKPTTSREHVRLAIGQVLDYQNLLNRNGLALSPAVLLPQRPSEDLTELMSRLGITLVVESSPEKFDVIPAVVKTN